MSKQRPDPHEAELINIGRTTAEVAHDLRNFLTPILAGADHLSTHPDEMVSDTAKRILRNAVLCRGMIDRMMESLGQGKPRQVRFDLADKLRSWIENRMGDAVVTWSQGEIGAALVDGNSGQITSLLENLIRNAEEAVNPAVATIAIELTAEDDFFLVTVSDSGPGIPKEERERVFEALYTSGKTGGTGLGLFSCRNIAAGHGGSLTLIDEMEPGATFRLQLPKAANVESVEPSPVALENPGPKLNILCVDDDQSTLDTYEMILGLDGHKVTQALSGREGMRLEEQRPYDIILCDLRLPDMSGMDFHRAMIRKSPRSANRMVFATGDLMNKESQDYLATAQRPYLIKPFEIEELRVAIRVALKASSQ